MKFVHLHNHTQHSLLDGCCRIKDMFAEAKAKEFPALAITDHGNMHGAIEFYKEGIATGIKPIIGCEMYIAPSDLAIKTPLPNEPSGGYHLVVLAKNETGYKNLIKLSSIASLDGFYYRPRIDKKALKEHSDGLIVSTACLKGAVPYWAIRDDMDRAIKEAGELADIVGKENFFLELQNHGIEEEAAARKAMIKIAKKNKFQMIATNDIHYLKKEHAISHDILVCIQTGKLVADKDRLKYSTDQLYMKSAEEMIEMFGEIPNAIDNTMRIAEMCNLKINLGETLLPAFPIPIKGMTPEQYLRHLATDGIKTRYEHPNKEISNRLEYELSVIDKTGFAGYFLIVQDFIKYAKDNGIPVGPGRGSVAGSLVAYAIGITEVDPLKYNLLFERFLNPDRISMPDIDVDFADDGRQKVIEYVIAKYGKENVGQISTFGTLGARSALRDVGRATGVHLSIVDKLAKAIPQNASLQEAEELPEVHEYVNSALWKHAKVLEGLHRHCSTHAAGVVIAPQALTEYTALCRGTSGEAVTQLDMMSIEALGLLKMDFLGLKTLTVIRDTISHIGTDLDINSIPLDDEATMQTFKDGNTIGIFQFESSGMRGYLKQLQPEGIEDLASMNALYRPGPLKGGVIPSFIRRKHGEESISYLHPKMESALKATYGIIVFQEQAMKIAQDLAGFTLGEADILRKAMGKKIKELMEAQREKFVSGCVSNDIDAETGAEVFDLIDKFSGYGFNKSHAVGYALIAYQTGYLKTHYPAEFMSALLTSEMDNSDRMFECFSECKRMGIEILPPDINESNKTFTPIGKSIRFGINAIKGIGHELAAAIQDNKPYCSIFDFATRIKSKMYNKSKLESLVGAGAFLSFGTIKGHLNAIDYANTFGRTIQSSKYKMLIEPDMPDIDDGEELSDREVMTMEKSTTGFYISNHPVSEFVEYRSKRRIPTIAEIKDDYQVDSSVSAIGVISKVEQKMTKTKKRMCTAILEDENSCIEIVFFPMDFEKLEQSIKEDVVVEIFGKIGENTSSTAIIVKNISRPSSQLRKLSRHNSKSHE